MKMGSCGRCDWCANAIFYTFYFDVALSSAIKCRNHPTAQPPNGPTGQLSHPRSNIETTQPPNHPVGQRANGTKSLFGLFKEY